MKDFLKKSFWKISFSILPVNWIQKYYVINIKCVRRERNRQFGRSIKEFLREPRDFHTNNNNETYTVRTTGRGWWWFSKENNVRKEWWWWMNERTHHMSLMRKKMIAHIVHHLSAGGKRGSSQEFLFLLFFYLIFLFFGCNLFFEAPLCWTTTLTRKEDGKRVHQTAHLHTDAADGYAPWCISALRLTVCAHPALFSTGCFIPLSFSLHFNVRSGKEKWLDIEEPESTPTPLNVLPQHETGREGEK